MGGQGCLGSCAALLFTAFVTGPKDFTPTTFQYNHSATTPAFQLATAVILSSPVLCWADRAEQYLNSPTIELVRTLPTTWDQTRVLPGSRIGAFAAFARRKGDDWWIGIINATGEATTYELDLGFLGEGRWRALAATDVPDDPRGVRMSATAVSAGERLPIYLDAAGGYTARLQPAEPRP